MFVDKKQDFSVRRCCGCRRHCYVSDSSFRWLSAHLFINYSSALAVCSDADDWTNMRCVPFR